MPHEVDYRGYVGLAQTHVDYCCRLHSVRIRCSIRRVHHRKRWHLKALEEEPGESLVLLRCPARLRNEENRRVERWT